MSQRSLQRTMTDFRLKAGSLFPLAIFGIPVLVMHQNVIMPTGKCVKVTSHLAIFEILVRPTREDQILPTEKLVIRGR